MSVSLQYPGTGEVKVLPEGWSWSCFFGATFLGLPLFKRGLFVWGSVMLVFDIAAVVVEFIDTDSAATLDFWMSVICVAASVFFGLKANDMAARHALANGWRYADQHRKWFD
jgi:hypothetical protein